MTVVWVFGCFFFLIFLLSPSTFGLSCAVQKWSLSTFLPLPQTQNTAFCDLVPACLIEGWWSVLCPSCPSSDLGRPWASGVVFFSVNLSSSLQLNSAVCYWGNLCGPVFLALILGVEVFPFTFVSVVVSTFHMYHEDDRVCSLSSKDL